MTRSAGDAERDPTFSVHDGRGWVKRLGRRDLPGVGGDIVVQERTPEELLDNLLLVLIYLLEKGPFAAARRCNVFARSAPSCGNTYSSNGMAHLP